ncbi:MAG: ATP-binding cassette domain-containing protein [Geminicoccaceae bacterium]
MLLVLEGVSKRYGETVALNGIDVAMSASHVHTVLGENGSGKSTLVKLLSGVVRPDSGAIRLDSQNVTLDRPAAARAHGIATVFQEVLLAPARTVLDNIFLGHDGLVTRDLPRRRRREVAEQVMASFARSMPDLDARGGEVPLAQQQLVVLARALVRNPRILILDEVTAALDAVDRDLLFEALRTFVAGGRLVLFISHRLDEVRRLSDRVTVLRNGSAVETLDRDQITSEALLRLMIPDAKLRVHGIDA